MDWGYFPAYVSVGERRARARRETEDLRADGNAIAPVEIVGNKIARTFWGQAWCRNLESYSDYANRLPRGRSYVRNGLVVDLQIQAGMVTALVSGTHLYRQEITIKPLAAPVWQRIKEECAGGIGSLVELLRGSLSRHVMEIVTRRGGGLFPTPGEIDLLCSCPDGAYMCKHCAAALYGVGSRLDAQPELLFKLRGVDHAELIEQAGSISAVKRASAPKAGSRVIAEDKLGAIFGVELDATPVAPRKTAKPAEQPRAKTATKSKSTEAKAKNAKSTQPPVVRGLSAEARKRIAEAQKRRWSGYKALAVAAPATAESSSAPAKKQAKAKSAAKKSASGPTKKAQKAAKKTESAVKKRKA